METYKITKNGVDLVNGLTKEAALYKFLPVVEDHSNGYIYDNENKTIYNEVDKRIVASEGDEYVSAGDNYFEIEKE